MLTIPSKAAIAGALRRPLPFATRPLPLRDGAPDAGLFGPHSVTWRVMREPILMLGAGRALLMQAAHPLVAQGAIDHSTYETDPYGRFERTILWVTMVSFGTTAEAQRVSRGVNALHRRVLGTLPPENATAASPGGTHYAGTDPHLLRWVHASFVDTMVVTHDALVGTLDDSSRDAFVVEWNEVATLMGVPKRLLFGDARQLTAYVAREVRRGAAMPGAGSRRVAETVLHPPVGSRLARPGMDLLAFIATGLLPREVRAAYGIGWTAAHAGAHRAACLWLRGVRPMLPRRLKISPVYEVAIARAEGRWPAREAA
jgi:uncharacterized protein (DUF2236 family)